MMNFRNIKASIVEILAAGANNCFVVVGHQRQGTSAEEQTGFGRTVQVFWSASDFPKSSGSIGGDRNNDATYRLELTVAAPAQGDVRTLTNPNASAAVKAMALLALNEGSAVADDSLDELVELVYQILSDATNKDMGQAEGVVSNPWVNPAQKDDPLFEGELVVLTASMFLTLRTVETITGLTATAAGDIQNTTLDIVDDDVEETGIVVND